MKQIIIDNYKSFIRVDWSPDNSQVEILSSLINFAEKNNYRISSDYRKAFIEAVSQKLDLNSKTYQAILDYAFFEHIKFNYLQKNYIKALLDSGDKKSYQEFLHENGINNKKLEDKFEIIQEERIVGELSKVCEIDKKYLDILSSIFSRYCFNLFDKKCSAGFFSNDNITSLNYFNYISSKYPDICKRDKALAFLKLDEGLFNGSYEEGCNKVLATIKKMFLEMNNHCEMIVYIPFICRTNEDVQWRLYSDITLFAEKNHKEMIDKTYFRWKKVGDSTKKYVDAIVPYNAEFDYAFQGFVFKDCFVLGKKSKYDLMLVFEKNVRDERIVNCPACFSSNIQGNSYPILNVRSWECENPLCPDRSKYNRGKRYAFMSLFRQYQLQDEDNKIPEKSIVRWHLDCIENCSYNEALEMAIRHYSCVKDTVVIYDQNMTTVNENLFSRSIEYREFENSSRDLLGEFKASSYFYRYIQQNYCKPQKNESCVIGKATIYHGDAYDVLRGFQDCIVDAVVTSPPYYNAKSYSQWANIYCYLYDMYNISREIYRVLKKDGIYLFNIFDYFDNENNIALSAMGDKRMILGAYMIDIFRRVGFQVSGNIIWNKGEIQGHRSFNQGNMTPYYQAPLNCWEHVLILTKENKSQKYLNLVSEVRDIRPVVKMVKGKNVLGHDAPYPKEIPELIIKYMKKEDVVLDPFLGSGTTSIVANSYGIRSIGIEKKDEYYQLCKDLIEKNK